MNLFSRTLAVLLAAIAVLFITSAAKVESATTKCQVCHNGKNPHTIEIACKNVQQYLDNHPGDTAGPCEGVTDEKPPKPNPHPKP